MSHPSTELVRLSGTGGFDLALAAANELLGPQAVCFLASPSQWSARWMTAIDRGFGDDHHVFEARWFDENGEVRWIRTPEGGRIAALTVGAVDVRTSSLTTMGPPVPVTVLERRYRCWGKVGDVDAGQRIATLVDRRIGSLAMPVVGAVVGNTLLISTWELVARMEHGNMGVIDEILRSIGPSNGRSIE